MSDITLSTFYHSAVNAVTKPNKFTATSNYFIDRWMPLLGGNGTMIVLALRRDGFLNRRTGECRDEIVISRAELAALAGMSEDTLTREMGVNRKTGKPQNEWLHLFVQKRTQFKRDKRGQVRQEENAYWIAMDDPIHPDDWPLVEQAVRAAEERRGKQNLPETQIAFPVNSPETQFASPVAQFAVTAPQNAPPKPQIAAPLKIDSSLLEMTLPDLTLNVSAEGGKASPMSRRQMALADQAVALTGDIKSRKRYQQLAGIVLDGGAGELWEATFKATEARLKKGSQPLDAPGAYFCATLTRLLGDAGLYVPVGTRDERDDVRAQITASLGAVPDPAAETVAGGIGAPDGSEIRLCLTEP